MLTTKVRTWVMNRLELQVSDNCSVKCDMTQTHTTSHRREATRPTPCSNLLTLLAVWPCTDTSFSPCDGSKVTGSATCCTMANSLQQWPSRVPLFPRHTTHWRSGRRVLHNARQA